MGLVTVLMQWLLTGLMYHMMQWCKPSRGAGMGACLLKLRVV